MKLYKNPIVMLVIIFGLLFYGIAEAYAGMNMGRGSAFSKWTSVSKNSHEKTGEKNSMANMAKKMKNMGSMKTGMKSMSKNMTYGLGKMDNMNDMEFLGSTMSDGMTKMKKIKKIAIVSPKIGMISGMGSMNKTAMAGKKNGDMKQKMDKTSKRMRKKMGGFMAMDEESADTDMNGLQNMQQMNQSTGGTNADNNGNTGEGEPMTEESVPGTSQIEMPAPEMPEMSGG